MVSEVIYFDTDEHDKIDTPLTKEQKNLIKEKFVYNGEYPYKLFVYRDQYVPVYSDDYGQQDYTVIDGKTYGGGAYNFFADEVFCSEIDYILEKKIIAAGPSPEDMEKKFFSELIAEYEEKEKKDK